MVSTQVRESLLYGNKSDQTTAPSKNMGESHKHNGEQKMSDTKERLGSYHFCKAPRQVELISATGSQNQGVD